MDWFGWLVVLLGAEFLLFGLLQTAQRWTRRSRAYVDHIGWPTSLGPVTAGLGAATMAAGLWLRPPMLYVVVAVFFAVLFWMNVTIARTVKDEDLRRASELAIMSPLRIVRHPIRGAKDIVPVYRLLWRSGRKRRAFHAGLRKNE